MLRLGAILIWSAVYFYASAVKIHSVWQMNVFKIKHWGQLFAGWRSGKWVIDTANDYIFCTVLALLIPVWLVGVFVICRLLRPKAPTAVIQKATASHPFIPAYTPAQMPSQGKSAAIEALPEMTPPVSNTAGDGQDAPTDFVPKDNAEAHALEVITQIAEDNALTPFPHVLLENELIPVTISSDVDAFLITVLALSGNWKVAMTEPLEQSVWSCNGQTKTVLKEIILGKAVLSKMEPDSKVTPVVVLAQGALENSDVVTSWLKQHGVEVVSLPENPQPGIPQLADVLIQYFGQSEEGEDNAEQNIATVQEASA